MYRFRIEKRDRRLFESSNTFKGRMLKAAISLLTVLILFILNGCSVNAASPKHKTVYALGTVSDIVVYDDEDGKTSDKLEQLLYGYDEMFSWRNNSSEISRINANSGTFVEVSKDTYKVLEIAKTIGKQSGGALDVTVGILTSKWNISENPHVPSEDEIKNSLPQINYKTIELKEESGSYYAKVAKGQMLDVGAIAKGYVADMLEQTVRENKKNALLNLGGNIVAVGDKPNGESFKVGIRDPRKTEQNYFCTVKVSDMSVVVSGAYERNFTENGVTYHHILDPKTGYPAESGIISSAVAAKSSAVADGFSTALFVLEKDRALEIAEKTEGIEAMLITSDGKIYTTSEFDKQMKTDYLEGTDYEKG